MAERTLIDVMEDILSALQVIAHCSMAEIEGEMSDDEASLDDVDVEL